MGYEVRINDQALKSLKKIDRYQAQIIFAWMEKNLAGCANPRIYGKALTGDKKGYWRYRVGAYRIIAEIQDQQIRIVIINISHRRDVYNQF